MAINIEKLLSKQKLGGREVGRVLMASMISDIENLYNPNYIPPLTQEQLYQLIELIGTNKGLLEYSVYGSIHSSLAIHYNRAQTSEQQFYHGSMRYYNYLILAYKAEKELKEADKFPFIIGHNQFKELEAQAQAELASNKESLDSLVLQSVDLFINDSSLQPTQEIALAILATKDQPATRKRILEGFNKVAGHGYEQLGNGQRSDHMSQEEWERVVSEAKEINDKERGGELLLKTRQLFYEGIEAIKKILPLKGPKEEAYALAYLEDIVTDGGPEGILKELEDTPIARKVAKAFKQHFSPYIDYQPEWHCYPDPPENLTKYDVLAKALGLYTGKGSDQKPHPEEFKEDYPELYQALIAYLEEAMPPLKRIEPSQRGEKIISWGELAELGSGYKARLTPNKVDLLRIMERDTERWSDSVRARISQGGLVTMPWDWAPSWPSELLEIKNTHNPVLSKEGIDSLINSSNKESNKDYLFGGAVSAFRHLSAYNALIDILGEVYVIKGLEVAKYPIDNAAEFFSIINYFVYAMYAEVYGDLKERQRRRALVKELFQPVDTESLYPKEEHIDAVKAELKALGYSEQAREALKNFDYFIDSLMGKGGKV